MEKILTLEEAAKYLKLSCPTVKRAAQRGTLPGGKVGGQWRFAQGAIDRFLHAHKTTTNANNSQIHGRPV